MEGAAARSAIRIVLTCEQQLEILAATGLMVSTLELPLAALEEGGDALARLPLPEWLVEGAGNPNGKEVIEDDPIGERGRAPD